MEYNTVSITSNLQMPYKILDIKRDKDYFILQFLYFDEHQTDCSIKRGGVTGQFGVQYQCKGIDAAFTCDLTIGNIYDFYCDLMKCYLNLNGIAVLQEYSAKNARLTVSFGAKGYCTIEGIFRNQDNQYKSAIEFTIDCDQTYIKRSIDSLDMFFYELAKVQGSDKFIY